MAPINKMDLTKFVEEGYLHELNRQFLHPLGLALEVICDEDGKAIEFGGVWDYREDPEGITFDSSTLNPSKAHRISEIADARLPTRVAALGYWVQPVTKTT